jgi:23S rRNA G2445 N2-methylase RlmL
MSDNHLQLLATTARGFEKSLADELTQLGVQNPQVSSGAVLFQADFCLAIRLCLWSRIANKIEVQIAETYVHDENDIYDLGQKIPLDPWFAPTATFRINAHVNDDRFKNSVFLSLKLKDGLVDHMRDAWHQRSTVDTQNPDITINLQVIQRKARVFIELQGDPLNMRGYRRRQIQAPIRETLAAAMIQNSGWKPERAFIDPMCGSGTFAIEAALIATQTAPGIQRHFGFEKLPVFPQYANAWRNMRDQAKELSRSARKNLDLRIRAIDIDNAALDIAQNNAQTAGVSDLIEFSRGNILDLRPATADIVTNPPYGERITVSGLDLPEFYFQLGKKLRSFNDATLTIISTAELLKKNMHMKPDLRIQTFNGPIACEVAHYKLGITKPR